MNKNTKHFTLTFIKNNKFIFYEDLMAKFNLTNSGARSYLLILMNQELVERNDSGKYSLTLKGEKRLDWFNKKGCPSKHCPKCTLLRSKNAVICPNCQELLTKNILHIQSENNFFLSTDNAGVYCPKCDEFIFTPKEAEKLGIKWEE